MKDPLRILIVEDSADDAVLLIRALCREGYEVVHQVVDTPAGMRAALEDGNWDVITSDHAMPRFSAPEALALAKELRPDLPFIILSGEIDLNLAVSLMRGGAQDYIQKRELPRIVPAIERELREAETRLRRKEAEQDLRKSEERYRFLLRNTPDYVARYSLAGVLLYASDAMYDMIGYKPEEVTGTSGWDRVHPDDLPHVLAVLDDAIKDGMKHKAQYRAICKDGGYKWVEISGEVVHNDQTGQEEVVAVVRDIDKRKRAETLLREREERFRRVSSIISDVVYSCKTDNEGFFSIDWMTGAAKLISGYSIEEIISEKCWRFLVVKEDLPLFEAEVTGLSPGAHGSCELRIRRKDGGIAWVASYAECVAIAEAPGGRRLFGGLIDITARKEAEEALQTREKTYRELSIHDGLTQLFNSRHFYDQLKMEIHRSDRYGQPLSMLFLDLDDFKRFNDTYGHTKGDNVLVKLSQVIKRQLRQTDSAYRYGGEEFIVLLPMTAGENGAVIAERIRAEFKKEDCTTVNGNAVFMTVSVGITQYKPGEEIKDLINRVDRLMYQAKKDGKNRISYR